MRWNRAGLRLLDLVFLFAEVSLNPRCDELCITTLWVDLEAWLFCAKAGLAIPMLRLRSAPINTVSIRYAVRMRKDTDLFTASLSNNVRPRPEIYVVPQQNPHYLRGRQQNTDF